MSKILTKWDTVEPTYTWCMLNWEKITIKFVSLTLSSGCRYRRLEPSSLKIVEARLARNVRGGRTSVRPGCTDRQPSRDSDPWAPPASWFPAGTRAWNTRLVIKHLRPPKTGEGARNLDCRHPRVRMCLCMWARITKFQAMMNAVRNKRGTRGARSRTPPTMIEFAVGYESFREIDVQVSRSFISPCMS